MVFQVAVVSANRPELFHAKTGALLAQAGLLDQAVVYVPQEQVTAYSGLVDVIGLAYPEPTPRIQPGKPNRLGWARNEVFGSYAPGQALLCLDDDLSGISWLSPEGEVINVSDQMERLVTEAFEHCYKAGSKLWGVYPVANPYFMRSRVRYDLSFIIGHMFGIIIGPQAQVSLDLKHDYELTLKHFCADGVVRFDDVMAITKTYGTKQGVSVYRSPANTYIAAEHLIRKYRPFVRNGATRKGLSEISLVRGGNKATAPSPFSFT